MGLSVVVDLVLLAVALGYLGYGVTFGFARSLVVGAAMVAALSLALVLRYSGYEAIADSALRVRVTTGTSLALVLVGSAIGHFTFQKLYFVQKKRRLRYGSRIIGGAGLAMLVLLMAATMSHTTGQFGVSKVAKAAAHSVTIQMVHTIIPHAVQRKFFESVSLLSAKRETALPENFGSPDLEMASFAGGEAELFTAAKSVVRITGSAYACGQGLTGTGFVVAADRVITNAHVVAGVTRPVIEAPNGQVLRGEVVHFDGDTDLAVIAVSGLDVNALSPRAHAHTIEGTKIVGYPYGGPITSTATKVKSIRTYLTNDIYDEGESPHHIYTLAGQFTPGVSGGPVLDLNGDYVGIVFARATHRPNLGYAMALIELHSAINNAATLTEPVSSGDCIAG